MKLVLWHSLPVPRYLNLTYVKVISLSCLFSDALSPCSSHNVRGQVSHPSKTTGEIIVLCILTLHCATSRQVAGSIPDGVIVT
jgi:sensor histidine kinase YesM